MQILLDTHALLWANEDDHRLPQNIKDLLNDKNTRKYVSTASFWELSIKHSLGKLRCKQAPTAMFRALEATDLRLLGITPSVLDQLENLPYHHRDPFDRLLIATALSEDLVLISADQQFQQYTQLKLLWG